MARKWNLKWNGWRSVFRVLLTLVLLVVFGPFFLDVLLHLLYVGHWKSYGASCQSNEKQLGLALAEYTQDNDSTLPSYATADGQNWRSLLFPYVKSTGLYHCPDDLRDSNNTSQGNLPKSYYANHIGPDAHHREQGVFAAPGAPVVNLTKLDAPSNTISLADARGYEGPEWNIVSPAFLPNTGRELFTHRPRHIFYEHPIGMINCLFVDGHVKALYPKVTLTPVNFWTRDNAPFTGQDLTNAQAILKHAEVE